ncbi:MAG: zinc ribbon domain-containing protein [Burkholderiales bacterium]|nr:zinc ribbon domain-containing protein [Burkholderiales bacterium]
MPIYEYTCGSCGREFETLVRGSSPAPECPACHGTELRKKLSTFAALSGAASGNTDLPAACGSCGHPGGPGACQFSGMNS